jgi:hypothetical protein
VIILELRDLLEDSTKITLLQFAEDGPREVEVELFYKNVLCPDIMSACAQIEREESDVPKATMYLQTCELEILFDDECVAFTPELFDLPTQEAMVAKIFKPLFIELHKYDGFTPEEETVLRHVELWTIICGEARGWYSPQPPIGLLEQAKVIIQRRRNDNQHQQA